MSTIDTCTNYKGEVTGYTPRHNSYYWMQHRADRIQDNLKAIITPYVEVGFDAQQIQQELHAQGERLVPTGQIESVISIILGEQV